MSLTVIKSDGSSESYIHTRVMATISAAISDAGCYNEQTVSALSDAVRMYIEDCRDQATASLHISSDDIYSMILATLQETGNGRAAVILKVHRITRQIKRKRQKVLHCLATHLPKEQRDQMDMDCSLNSFNHNCDPVQCPYLAIEPWNKSRLANKIINDYNLTKNAARVVAANIEEKIFSLKISVVRSMLIKQLILNELFLFRNASDFIEHKSRNHPANSMLINELPDKQPKNSYFVPNRDANSL